MRRSWRSSTRWARAVRGETSILTVTVVWEEIWATELALEAEAEEEEEEEVVREVRGLDTPGTMREVITRPVVAAVLVVLEVEVEVEGT